jgi:SPP1 gp7 family putative phage head morphogenesis protein
MKTLPPQRLLQEDFFAVEESLRESFRTFLFEPLGAILKRETTQADELFNDGEAHNPELVRALREGTIQYRDGVFSGDFEAATSGPLRDLGAEFDVRSGVFRLPDWAVPAWVKAEAATARARAERISEALKNQLHKTKEKLDAGQLPAPISLEAAADAVGKIEEGFAQAAEAVGISKKIEAGARRRIERHYAEDVRPYVTEATAKYIDKLHRIVDDNAAAGFRYDHLVDDIKRVYGVSQRKAKFLARQETSLFMSGYRRERFESAGVVRYVWLTSKDARVRCGHRELEGRVFFYSSKAPAEYMSSKKPCNPGEDFNCRCRDKAILDPMEVGS